MYKLIEYISDLLFLHDCVVIPDFGGFICNYKSAYIDEVNGVICPPSKNIIFNRSLTHNDGLLVNWVAAKENISYEKAVKQIALFCEDLKIRLNQKQRIEFGEIGIFYTDRRFNVIFDSGKGNFLSDTLGMEALDIKKIIKTTAAKTNRTTVQTPETPIYMLNSNSGNFVHRLLKYALAITACAGILLIVQLGVTYFGTGNRNTLTTTVQPALPTLPTGLTERKCNNVISPLYDYVDYNPILDLKR